MMEKITSRKEIERNILLNDPEINEKLRNIITIIKDHGNQIRRDSYLWRDLALKKITWLEFLSHTSLPLPF